MWSDPSDLVTWLGTGYLGLLVVPKRGWRQIVARLGDARRGERLYVCAPPTRQGELAQDFSERWAQVLRREWFRLVELGLPVYPLACLAERSGAHRRRRRAEAWARSSGGLLLEHLTGRMPEAELHARLTAGGCPLPAVKLAPPPPRDDLLPPASWIQEWHQEQRARHEQQVLAGSPRIAQGLVTPSRLLIRTLGEIRLVSGGTDNASALSRKPVLGFIWFYLLALHARSPSERIARAQLGDELYDTYPPRPAAPKGPAASQRPDDCAAGSPARLPSRG